MIRNNSFLLSLAASLFALPALCVASELTETSTFGGSFSGNIGVVSDYIFRGISQTREHPALQGGIDYVHPNGLYAGAWGSSVDFSDNDNANIEIDGYVGYSHSYEKWVFDGRLTYYAYPGAKSSLRYNYYEIGSTITYDFDLAKLAASLNFTPENFGDSGYATYYSVSTAIPLPHNFSLNAKVGHQEIEDNIRYGYPSYTEWSAGIAYQWNNVTLGAQYIDTNLTTSECSDGCDARGIISATYAF